MSQPTNYGTGGGTTSAPANVGVTTAFVAPFDRVRWGPVLAGLFAAMSTLALLSVLGLAIGLTAWDPGDNTRNYTVGAGIWSIVSALIAFFVGGWLAARSAAAAGERNGLLNGSMVWAVAIPLLIFLVGGGIASLAQTAIGGPRNARVVYLERGGGAGDSGDRAQTAAGRIGSGGDAMTDANNADAGGGTISGPRIVDADTTRDEARTAARSAWWTLLSLVLGLCAAAVGGLTGARSAGFDYDDRSGTASRDYNATTTTGGTTAP